jgi:hypothetical protein
MGQDRARDFQQPEDIGLINAPCFLVVDLLNPAEQTEAGVVDENIDGPEFLHRFGRDLHGLEFFIDVQDGDLKIRMMVEFGGKLSSGLLRTVATTLSPLAERP